MKISAYRVRPDGTVLAIIHGQPRREIGWCALAPEGCNRLRACPLTE